MYYEDSDFCYRTRKEGFHIFFNQSINVYHKISGSGGKPETLTMQYYRSKILFFRKHYGAAQAALLQMGVGGTSALKWAVFGIMGLLPSPRRSVLSAQRDRQRAVLQTLRRRGEA